VPASAIFEAVIAGLVGVIVVGFAFQILHAHPSAAGVLHGLFTPRFAGGDSVLLAVGILGATVMPHVIYLHSALTQRRVVGATEAEKRQIFRFELAGVINMSMLVTAAGIFHARGLTGLDDLQKVYDSLGRIVGVHADTFFGIALLTSGLSSSSVGTSGGGSRSAFAASSRWRRRCSSSASASTPRRRSCSAR
jgi:manganese transport protein